jgi:hypothetical protein
MNSPLRRNNHTACEPSPSGSKMQARERFFSDRTRNLHAESPASHSLHGVGDTF